MNEYNEELLRLRRNDIALAETLNRHEQVRLAHDRSLSQISAEVATIRQQVQELTITVAVLRAKMQGGGPTA